MPDAYLEWNSDFAVSSTGGLLMADGDDLARQRLERRLFTAVQGYVWDKTYGAGLPQQIGNPYTVTEIQALVMKQVALEASVAANPPPQVTVSAPSNIPGAVSIGISYTDAKTGTAVSFTITT